MTLPVALAALGQYRQFITYKLVPLDTGKYDKVPCDYRTGQVGVNPHDPQYHTDYATVRSTGEHIGFVLTDNDPFFCLDIDGCLQADQTWSPLALSLLQRLPGTACEASISGRGLHLWGTYRSIPPHKAKDSMQPRVGLELYHNLRFIALGRADATGDATLDCTAALIPIIEQYFAKRENEGAPDGAWDEQWNFACARGPVPQWRGSSDDEDLIRRAKRSVSTAGAFGNKAQFIDLWECNEAVLSVAFPHDMNPFDVSTADASLAAHLRFWTGEDHARIERLMRQSDLVRDKYDRADYLPRTILAVCGHGGAVCQDKLASPVTRQLIKTVEPPDIKPRTESVFAGAEEQKVLFKGCIYINETKEMLMPNGLLLDQEQFDGKVSTHVFLLDNENSKTTDSAWKCFMKSKMLTFPKADRSMFRPELPTGHIEVQQSGISYVNTYSPHGVVPREGAVDASPFLDLLTKMLPDRQDCAVLLAYLAFIVQYPGVKAQWAPVLQGVEGNGKSTILEFLRAIIGKEHYYSPDASELTGKFNSWIFGKRLIGVEDMSSFGARVDPIEWLKPKITQTSVEIERKGKDKRMVEHCANFFFNMNSKDGLRKTRNDRRLAFLYSAQQRKEDLKFSGMTPEYFRELKHWQSTDGYPIVAAFLRDYVIPDALNPVNGGHAPATSATTEALRISADPVEQEILENIEQERPGFIGGWISSIAFDRMLADMRMPMSRNRRRWTIENLGYVRHPGLKDGRVFNHIIEFGGSTRPILYIRPGHLSLNMTKGVDVARAYVDAQGFAAQNAHMEKWS